MGYVRNPCEVDPEGLEGFWGAIGGGLKRVGQFAVKTVTGVSIGNGEPAPPPPILSDRGGEHTGMPIDERSFLEKLRDRALQRASEDPALRERVIATTTRYAPPELLAAAAARQARAAPPLLKAGVILPALAVGALLLRRR